MPDHYKLFVNAERTIKAEVWPEQDDTPGFVTVATRDHPGQIWGPPVTLKEEV